MEIDFCRRFILNPLCHEAAGRPNRGEAELALSSLKQLKIAVESADSWRTAWDQLHPKGHALPQSWHLALCEWLLSKTPKAAVCDCGAAIREAFIVALDSYNQRHRASITYSADSYVTRRIQWESAKIASLAAAQPAFVALIEANASWLLNEAPSATDWGAVTEVQTTSVFDGLRDGTKGQRISCALSTW